MPNTMRILLLAMLVVSTHCQAAFLQRGPKTILQGERDHESKSLDDELALTVQDITAKDQGNKILDQWSIFFSEQNNEKKVTKVNEEDEQDDADDAADDEEQDEERTEEQVEEQV